MIFVRLIARVPVCVHRVESEHHLRATFEPGQPLPLLRGASGRVLLAGLPERLRREYLAPLAQSDPAAAARPRRSSRRSPPAAGRQRGGDRPGRLGRVGGSDGRAFHGRGADRAVSAGPRPGRAAGAAARPGPGRRRQVSGLIEEAATFSAFSSEFAVLISGYLTAIQPLSCPHAGFPEFVRTNPRDPWHEHGFPCASVARLRRAMTDGELTATALTRRYLDRIADVNPVLGAVIAVTPDALEQAAASDAAWQAGSCAGPLRESRSWSRTTFR